MRICLLALLLSGCAHQGLPMPGPLGTLGEPVGREAAGVARQEAPAPTSRKSAKKAKTHGGEAVAVAAADLIGRGRLVVNGKTYRGDCSGLVEAAYAQTGRTLAGSVRDLYAVAKGQGVLHHKKVPSPGDVAFFDDTWDANGNRRRDDDLSHVALVESVADDGTINLIHMGSHGVVRIRMNLKHPDVGRGDEGAVLNDGLRAGRDDGGPRLSGQLWRAFGSFWQAAPTAQDPGSKAVASQ